MSSARSSSCQLTGSSARQKIKSIIRSPSNALISQPSGGRCTVMPAASKARAASSVSISRMTKSTSCTGGAAPRAYAAPPPANANGIPASRSMVAAFFIVSTSGGSGSLNSVMAVGYPRG
jgi:hypothetical protein